MQSGYGQPQEQLSLELQLQPRMITQPSESETSSSDAVRVVGSYTSAQEACEQALPDSLAADAGRQAARQLKPLASRGTFEVRCLGAFAGFLMAA